MSWVCAVLLNIMWYSCKSFHDKTRDSVSTQFYSVSLTWITNAIFQRQIIHPIIYLVFRDLGHIAGGMSCDWLKLWTNETDFSELLQFVSELPGGVRPALVRNHKLPTWYPSCPPPLLFPSHSFLLSIFRYIFLSRKVFLELFRASYFILVCSDVLCFVTRGNAL